MLESQISNSQLKMTILRIRAISILKMLNSLNFKKKANYSILNEIKIIHYDSVKNSLFKCYKLLPSGHNVKCTFVRLELYYSKQQMTEHCRDKKFIIRNLNTS
jgi:hypothetical protein